MKKIRTQFGLSVLAWINLLRNLVSAISLTMPNEQLDSDFEIGSACASDLKVRPLNLTSRANDPDFGFSPVFHGAQLPPVPCLLDSVNAVLRTALEEFEGVMFETVFRLESHPQVEIAVTPEEKGGSVRNKFIVWGLNMGMDTNTPSVDTVDPSNDPHLRVDFQLTGSVVSMYDIFEVALDLISDFAYSTSLEPAICPTSVLESRLETLSFKEKAPRAHSTILPYLQPEWLMEALAQMPAYMLERQSFREVEMVIFVDEIRVGEVSVRRQVSEIGLMQASDDVSTSR